MLGYAPRKPPRILNNIRKIDPAGILPIRARLEREVRRRYAALKKDIATSIVTNDCFDIAGMTSPTALVALPGKFEFVRTDQKIAGFMKWLQGQQEKGILDISYRPGVHSFGPWQGVYIDSYYVKNLRETYGKSIETAREKIRQAGYPIDVHPIGSMNAYMQQPFHVERVGMIYSRAYKDLKTVTELTGAGVRRSVTKGLTEGLARGMAEGKNPRAIARELLADVTNKVDSIGQVRALMIARTEVAAANHSAAMSEYRQAEVDGVSVEAEILTSGLDNVCDECEGLAEDGPYTLDQAEGLIPAHPSCACTLNPVVKPPDTPEEAQAVADEDQARQEEAAV